MSTATAASSGPPNAHAHGAVHYPPDLLQLIKNTIPLLCASKKDTIVFFLNAGVPESWMADLKKQVEACRADVTKVGIANRTLDRLNLKNENHLRQLDEVLRRVTGFDDFSTCSPTVRAKAMESVAELRRLPMAKDAVAGMGVDTEVAAPDAEEKSERGIQAGPPEQEKIPRVTKDLCALFGESDAIRRAKALEGVLNRLFATNGMHVRESFASKGSCGEGVIEQIEGVVEIDGDLYLVEMKWLNKPIGTTEISPHLVRVYGRGEQARGIFISYSEYTEAAIDTCRQAFAGGVLAALCRLSEIVAAVERDEHGTDLRNMLRTKVHAALRDKKPWLEYVGS